MTCLLGFCCLYFLSEKWHKNLECLGLTHMLFAFKWADLKKKIYLYGQLETLLQKEKTQFL